MTLERKLAFNCELYIKLDELEDILTAKNTDMVQVCIQATYIKGMLNTAQICGFITTPEAISIEKDIDHKISKAERKKKL